jgi:hypothetical protein
MAIMSLSSILQKSFQEEPSKPMPLLEGRLQFSWQDLKAFQGSKHIHEPELDQLDLVFTHGFDDIVGIFAIEDRIFGHGFPPQQGVARNLAKSAELVLF